MRWLRLVGSLKTQVSFAKEPYKRNHILQKKPILLRSLLIIASHPICTQRLLHIDSYCTYTPPRVHLRLCFTHSLSCMNSIAWRHKSWRGFPSPDQKCTTHPFAAAFSLSFFPSPPLASHRGAVLLNRTASLRCIHIQKSPVYTRKSSIYTQRSPASR